MKPSSYILRLALFAPAIALVSPVATANPSSSPSSYDQVVEHREIDGTLSEINYYKKPEKRALKRTVLKPKYGLPATYTLEYKSEDPNNLSLAKMWVNPENTKDWIPFVFEPIPTVGVDHLFSRKLPAAMIIDSGFLPLHPLLAGKHFKDPISGATTIHGRLTGGSQVDYEFHQIENLKLPRVGGGAPLSHGTFVASVAMKDIEHASFIGVAGDIYASSYLYKMMEIIRDKGIRFTNMSFGFGDRKSAPMIDKLDFEALISFIQFQPNVLHVVASGNHGVNFDEVKYSEYPACVKSLYSVVVGGLATGELHEEKLSQYERSKMASHGNRCVDIMGPAENVVGAGIWPEEMKASGTSVASPYVLNVLLKMHSLSPALDTRVYRELLLKTAYVPKQKKFSVRSGGIVHERRAILATQIHRQGKTVDEAVQLARKSIFDSAEINDFLELQKIWDENKLRF